MLHARATTKGTEAHNPNNHPVNGFGWVTVHNGHVFNDDDLFAYYKKPRFAEVDTAAINLVLSQGTDYLDSLQKVTLLGGQATAAVWGAKYPDKIALFRLGANDVYLFIDQADGIVYWSSAPVAGRFMPYLEGWGSLRPITMSKLDSNRMLVLDQERAFGGRTFVLTPSPFTLPARRGGTTTSHGSERTPVGFSHNHVVRAGVIRHKWFSTNIDRLPYKPGPTLPGADKFSWDATSITMTHRRIFEDEKLSSYTLETAYGRWIFRKGKAAKESATAGATYIDREFRPHRRMQKFFMRYIERIPTLPQGMLVKAADSYDRKLMLEPIVSWEYLTSGSKSLWEQHGFLCPWCGIWSRQSEWLRNDARCSFCRIQSLVPPEVWEKENKAT